MSKLGLTFVFPQDQVESVLEREGAVGGSRTLPVTRGGRSRFQIPSESDRSALCGPPGRGQPERHPAPAHRSHNRLDGWPQVWLAVLKQPARLVPCV